MEKIFILGNNKTLANYLEGEFIEIPDISSDFEIHNWLISKFQNNNIDKVIIEIGRNEILSMKIGLHIRLSLNELKEKSFIPIFFVSTVTLHTVMLKTDVWSHILVTKGVYFSTLNDVNSIAVELSEIQGITKDDYQSGFLDRVRILPDEAIGRHSLANIWGAYSMDKAAKTSVLLSSPEFIKRSTELYFKYISAVNSLKMLSIKSKGFINLSSPNLINAQNKKILLIDDEADKGWMPILKRVFVTSSPDDFVVIQEKVNGYDGLSPSSKTLLETSSFDLYLVDLRLGGLAEEDVLNPDDFSGMNVLRKIKSLNQGNQVIIFTASNKVWNLKALLDAGADGYYMKESPEFGFTSEFSEENYQRFKEDVEKCFKRDFLKDIFFDMQFVKSHIQTIADVGFQNELLNQFDLFWNMVSKARTKTDFAYAYVTLYLIIEIINNHFYQQTTDNKWDIKSVGKLLDWQWDNSQKVYTNTNQAIAVNNPPEWLKIAGLFFQKWGQTDGEFIMNIYSLIQKRNGFMHGDKTILNRQNNKGRYLNRDIFTKEGILKLNSAIKRIIQYI